MWLTKLGPHCTGKIFVAVCLHSQGYFCTTNLSHDGRQRYHPCKCLINMVFDFFFTWFSLQPSCFSIWTSYRFESPIDCYFGQFSDQLILLFSSTFASNPFPPTKKNVRVFFNFGSIQSSVFHEIPMVNPVKTTPLEPARLVSFKCPRPWPVASTALRKIWTKKWAPVKWRTHFHWVSMFHC